MFQINCSESLVLFILAAAIIAPVAALPIPSDNTGGLTEEQIKLLREAIGLPPVQSVNPSQ